MMMKTLVNSPIDRRRLVFGGAAFAASAALSPAIGRTGLRTALVIGNADYLVAPLSNPVNDARLVARTLLDVGFEVGLLENATLREMKDGIRQWIIRATNSSVRTFYYAGHGTQYQGENFIVPVDLEIQQERQIRRKALQLSDIVQSLSAQTSGVNLVIIDACRTDPSALLARNGSRTRSLDDPLLSGFVPEVVPRGTVVSYSTSPGALAADGIGSQNSVFTEALAREMKRPGMPIEDLFKKVRISVMRATRNAQIPWERSSLVGKFCILRDTQGGCG